MRAVSGLHLDYVSLAEYQAARWGDVLGVAAFNGSEGAALNGSGHIPPNDSGAVARNSSDAGPPGVPAKPLAPVAKTAATAEIPIAEVSTPVLPAAAHLCEVWRCSAPAESGRRERVRFRRTEDMLFGCIAVTESQAVAGAAPRRPPARESRPPSPLQEATTELYRQICATLDAEGYPHLLRVWNFVPDINRDSHGTERYRQFNSARQYALLLSGRPVTGRVSAASALGAAHDSPVVAYFLAGRIPPTFVENPRQVSAYHYPRRYGTHPPVFSRATLLRQAGSLTLFISGTASIVGHRSLHVGDTAAQTRETLANLEALLAEANRVAPGARFSLSNLACKVYVRRPADLPVVEAELASAVGAGARVIYLQADICRQDLLVEIEATAMCPLAAA